MTEGNIEGLSVELSEEDINQIEEAAKFDIGFPQSFLGGPKGVQKPSDGWLLNIAGVSEHVLPQRPIGPIKK